MAMHQILSDKHLYFFLQFFQYIVEQSVLENKENHQLHVGDIVLNGCNTNSRVIHN